VPHPGPETRDCSASHLHARVKCPACSEIRRTFGNSLISAKPNFGSVLEKQSDRAMTQGGSARQSIVRRYVGETRSLGTRPVLRRTAPARVLPESGSCGPAARFWCCHSFGFSQSQKFSEHPTLHRTARPARLYGRGRQLGYDRCVRGVRPDWRHRGSGPVEVR
jgi:hypothetical protein